MNRIKLLTLSAIFSLTAQAQLTGSGFYRIQNTESQRYITVTDGYGKADYTGRKADVSALKTVKDFNEVACDPSSVIYFEEVVPFTYYVADYNLKAQGMNTYSFFSKVINITDLGNNRYRAGATEAGITLYLFDTVPNKWSDPEEIAYGSVNTGEDKANEGGTWYILPMSESNYLGVKPDVTTADGYWKSYCVCFPITLGSGMTAYTISSVDESKGYAIIQPTGNTIAGATPVIIKCAGAETADNKVTVSGTPTVGTKPITTAGNELKGVYFSNTKEFYSNGSVNDHYDAVKYDAATMRVLGTTATGQLAFIKAEGLEYIPTNSTYITVSAEAPDVLYAVEANDTKVTAIPGDLNNDGEVNVTDYAILCTMLANGQTANFADLNNDGKVNSDDATVLNGMIDNSTIVEGTTDKATTLSIGEVSIKAGSTATMAINLLNPDFSASALQFDMTLPEGITISSSEKADRASNHTLTTLTTDGKTRFTLSNSGNAAIDGTEGAIINVTIAAAEDFKSGTVTLSGIIMTSPAAEQLKAAPVSYTIEAQSEPEPTTGDLSGDDIVDGSDLVIEVNYILNGSYLKEADLDNNGVVDGADYVILVNIILGKQ